MTLCHILYIFYHFTCFLGFPRLFGFQNRLGDDSKFCLLFFSLRRFYISFSRDQRIGTFEPFDRMVTLTYYYIVRCVLAVYSNWHQVFCFLFFFLLFFWFFFIYFFSLLCVSLIFFIWSLLCVFSFSYLKKNTKIQKDVF